MRKLLTWAIVALIAALVVSEININTSLYKAQDNSVEIIFPQWQPKQPWFYFYWTPGKILLAQPEEEQD